MTGSDENSDPSTFFRESASGVNVLKQQDHSGVGKIQGSVEGIGGLKPVSQQPVKKDTTNDKK